MTRRYAEYTFSIFANKRHIFQKSFNVNIDLVNDVIESACFAQFCGRQRWFFFRKHFKQSINQNHCSK